MNAAFLISAVATVWMLGATLLAVVLGRAIGLRDRSGH